MSKSTNIVWHSGDVTRSEREALNGQKGFVLWLTGLSGSGKSTVSRYVEKKLHDSGRIVYVLDGDNIRHGLNKDLTFSEDDRRENIRRISEVAKLFADAGIIVLTAFISPFIEDRNNARAIIGEGSFGEIYVKCDIEECEKRDVKGLYKKARNGDIKDFTGISSPYEEPENPEVIVYTSKESLEESGEKIIGYLKAAGVIEDIR